MRNERQKEEINNPPWLNSRERNGCLKKEQNLTPFRSKESINAGHEGVKRSCLQRKIGNLDIV